MTKEVASLTDLEYKAFRSGFNLSDGHARSDLSPKQRDVIDRLPEIYRDAERISPPEAKQKFLKTFFSYAGQASVDRLPEPLVHPAGSYAIDVIANYLHQQKKSVSLVHPTFDCIADILKLHDVALTPIEEQNIYLNNSVQPQVSADALFLVVPNNPTGTEISRKRFEQIVSFCKDNKKLLILDFSFRFYGTLQEWDQYEVLQNSGIDFIAVEDTGKTWPTQEQKAGTIVTSSRIYEDVKRISDSYILIASQFTFLLLDQLILAEESRVPYSVGQVQRRREELRRLLTKTSLSSVNPASTIGVEWIRLPEGENSDEYVSYLAQNGVHTLPGGPFFWADSEKGYAYIRISLVRSKDYFSDALKKLEYLMKQ